MAGSIDGVRGGEAPELPEEDAAAGGKPAPAESAEPSGRAAASPRGGPTSAAWSVRAGAAGGKPAAGPAERSALQEHVAFFDRNGDGSINVSETDEGLRALGLAPAASPLTAAFIVAGLAKDTTGSLLGMKVSVDDIHLGKHGGDTGSFDAGGNFVPERFEALWAKFDTDRDGKLTRSELDRMVQENTRSSGTKEKLAARGEFFLLLDLAGTVDASGEKVITRDRLRSFYDGSLFPEIARERAEKAAATGADPLHGDVNAGLPGLARHFGGILAGAAAGAELGRIATLGEDAAKALTAPLVGAMRAVCPGLKAIPG